jgi:hypothetical protein
MTFYRYLNILAIRAIRKVVKMLSYFRKCRLRVSISERQFPYRFIVNLFREVLENCERFDEHI